MNILMKISTKINLQKKTAPAEEEEENKKATETNIAPTTSVQLKKLIEN